MRFERKVVRMERRHAMAVLAMMTLAILMAAQAALADPSAPLSLNEGTGSQRNLSTLAAQQVSAQGGYVTPVNITALSITKSWQGYYGNVSGTIVLDDASNNTFYNWSMATVKGEIYATRTTNPTWSGVNCLSTANVATEETYLGQATSDADSVSNTYSNATYHPAFDVGSTTIPADDCYATNAFDSSGSQNTKFYQMLLQDGGGNIVYTTLMNGSQTGFDGSPWDFELLVGENEHAGSEGTTPYYFWVELG